MDESRFDDLTRSWSTSRRGAIRTIIGGVVATIAGVAQADSASSKDKNPFGVKRGEPFYNVYGTCKKASQCGTATECRWGLCYPTGCGIGTELLQGGALNPANPCEKCQPDASITAWSQWTPLRDGSSCANTTGNTCLADFGHCRAGECMLEPDPNGEACGDGQECCAGVCCPPGTICGASGACVPLFEEDPDSGDEPEPEPEPEPDPEPDPDEDDEDDIPGPVDPDPCPNGGECESEEPVCTIDSVEYQNGVRNPAMECQVCDANALPNAWSFVEDNTACGGVPDRYCCQGICCTPGNCCNPVGLCVRNVDFACPDLYQ
jgi:hypothetical protein